jgi:hypothetical protein
VGGKGAGGGRGEKWAKPCMHIWIIKEKEKKIILDFNKKKEKESIKLANIVVLEHKYTLL